MRLSRSQVDRLGERLRGGNISDDDLRLLDAYRQSFAEPYAEVLAVLRDELGLAPTGRLAKSTKSIVEKLERETARLSQMQDIAGCRVITADVEEQDRTIQAIHARFGDVTVVDRRARPSSGYRAVHMIVAIEPHRVEIQVRTALQQLWAELSETLADRFGIAVKYGGGDDVVRELLGATSESVAEIEAIDAALADPDLSPAALARYPKLAARVTGLRAERQLHIDQARALFTRAIANFSAPDP